MKRNELTVGAELAWSRSEQYDEPIKVTVLAVEPYQRSRFKQSVIAPCSGGNGVRVSKTGWNHVLHEDVVQLAQLRGPYAEYKAAWDARKEAERDADRRQRQARDDANEQATRLCTALAGIGIKAYPNSQCNLVIGPDEAAKIIRMLAEVTP